MTGKSIAIFLFLKRILKTGYIKPRLYVYKYLLWLHNQFHRYYLRSINFVDDLSFDGLAHRKNLFPQTVSIKPNTL